MSIPASAKAEPIVEVVIVRSNHALKLTARPDVEYIALAAGGRAAA